MLVDQPDTGGGHVIISVPVKVNLNSGANSITFGSGQSSASLLSPYHTLSGTPWASSGPSAETTTPLCPADYAADLDKIIVY